MPLKIIRQDITRMSCDAIVNPSNEDLLPGGGVDAAIHEAAGPDLLAACRALGGVSVGGAKMTPAYALPCRFVIHTAGPVWRGGTHGEEALLTSCYTESLRLAAEAGCESVAFPLISSGLYGYPKDRVLKVAVSAISDFLLEHELEVFILVFDKTAFTVSEKLFSDVTAFIDDRYAAEHGEDGGFLPRSNAAPARSREIYATGPTPRPSRRRPAASVAKAPAPSLEDMLRAMDKGFADTLFELIDARGITDVDCYKGANVDKKTFSKLKCNKDYKPSKVTAVSFAISLRLTPAEADRLLRTAGLSLSRSSKFDVVIEYFLTTGNYESIHDVNEVLWQLDLQTLGVYE